MNLFPFTTSKRSTLRAMTVLLAGLSLSALPACAPGANSNGSVSNATSPAPAQNEEADEAGDPVVPASPELLAKLALFNEPQLTEKDDVEILSTYSFVDPNGQVPKSLLSKALSYYEANKSHIDNDRYLSVVDFSKNSADPRLYVINMSTGSVWTIHVAHGKGSDPDNDGFANRFSNAFNSNESSLGYYRTAETYSGKHGYSLRIDGLSSSNSNVRARAVVVHGADYVHDSDVKAGRSNGCLAVSMNQRTKLIDMIKSGSVIYAGQE